MAIGPFLLGRHFCRSEESNVKKNIYWDMQYFVALSYFLPPPDQLSFVATTGAACHCAIYSRMFLPPLEIAVVSDLSAALASPIGIGSMALNGQQWWTWNCPFFVFRPKNHFLRLEIPRALIFFYRFLSSAPKEENHPVCGALAAPDHKIVR